MLPFRTFLLIMKNTFFFFFDQAVTKVEKLKGGKKVRPFYPVKRTKLSRFKGTKRNVSFCFVKFSVVAEGRERRLYLLLLFKGGSAYPSPWMQSLLGFVVFVCSEGYKLLYAARGGMGK